jgi:MSHA biogenesis protein MshK
MTKPDKGHWPLATGQILKTLASRVMRHVSRTALLSLACSTAAIAADLVDPTRPPVVARKVTGTAPVVDALPRVTAIFQSGERRVAVFEGQVVKAGDRVGDVFIESISVDGVRYRRAGRVEFARLPKQEAVVRQKIDSEESEP